MTRFSAFTTRYAGRASALQTPVKVSTSFDYNNPPPRVAFKQFTAIWDTGATGSVISQKVIDECKLLPISVTNVRHAGGISKSNIYSVSFFLRNNVAIPEIEVTRGILGDIDVLIGMDVISHGDFAVTLNKGKTVFSFRIPSATEIDFSGKDKFIVEKVGRNQPCSCGSGKKYKKCCGKV